MTIEAYAKVNLTLEVLGLRPDGYHALRSVVAPVSLCDTLDVVDSDAFSSDTGFDDDLCVKAAKALDPSHPVAIRVCKRIPVGGGLGGGSADAAATLLAVNRLHSLGHSPEELAEIAIRVGSDVPALVLANACRSAVLMEGRGESVTLLPEYEYPSRHLVLVNPGVNSSTRDVFAACDGDSLEPAAVRLYPQIADAMTVLRTAGATGVRMSGAGSTVFGFVADAASGNVISEEINSRGYAAWAVTVLQGLSRDVMAA